MEKLDERRIGTKQLDLSKRNGYAETKKKKKKQHKINTGNVETTRKKPRSTHQNTTEQFVIAKIVHGIAMQGDTTMNPQRINYAHFAHKKKINKGFHLWITYIMMFKKTHDEFIPYKQYDANNLRATQ